MQRGHIVQTKMPDSTPRIVIVSPVRNEDATLERTIACVESQSLRPTLWVIVDDGSSDRTPKIIADAMRRIPWLRVVTRQDRGYRKVGGGVIDAFYAGLEKVDIEYDYIGKMDVDLEFPSQYLETLMEYFDDNPNLAAASGKVYRPQGDGLVEEFMIDEMVAGQFKLYRRACFERIGGFVHEVMWDGIDFHKCRMAGYQTASLPDRRLRITHLRLMGSSDSNVYKGRLRWGRGQWFMGSSFPYVVASGVFRAKERPYFVGGALIVAGYLLAAVKRERRFDEPGFRESLRTWQRRRLVNLLRGKGPR